MRHPRFLLGKIMSVNNKMESSPILCPSAQPTERNSTVFGVVTRDQDRPRIGYLTKPQEVTEKLLALAEPALPTEIFRIAAPCATLACQHFSDNSCKLASRITKNLLPVVNRLPPCRIRSTCRWFYQEGKQACLRCPQVVTHVRDASEEWRKTALPNGSSQLNAS